MTPPSIDDGPVAPTGGGPATPPGEAPATPPASNPAAPPPRDPSGSASTAQGGSPGAESSLDGPSLDDIAAHLAATSVFGNLEPDALRRLAPCFHPAHFGAGTVLAHQDRIDRTLWVVIEGGVALQRRRPDGGADVLGYQGYADVVGVRGVFAATARTHDAVTAEPSTLLYADGRALWEALYANPELVDALILPDPVRLNLRLPTRSRAIRDERAVHVFRRHWIALVPRLLVLPPLAFAVFAGLALLVSLAAPSAGTMGLLAGLGVGATILVSIWLFLDYWNDELSITNRRIVHRETTPLINVQQSAARLERVQDVRVVQPTLLAKLLGYGDIAIQTAGTRGMLRFTMVPHPEAVRELVFAQARAARELAERERQDVITRRLLHATGRGSPVVEDDAPLSAASASPGPPAGGFVHRLVDALGLWTMREDAAGVITWRKHWWVLLRRCWVPGLALTACTAAVAWSFASAVAGPAGGDPAAGPVASAATGAWRWLGLVWLVVLMWLGWRVADWRNDLYVLTDEHVIDIEQLPLGLFSERRQASLGQIQDVRYTVPHPWARLLHYGTVVIQTAAEAGGFTFEYVHRPASVQEKIFMRMDQREQRLQQEEQRRRDEEMLRWLTTYHEITDGPPSAGEQVSGRARD